MRAGDSGSIGIDDGLNATPVTHPGGPPTLRRGKSRRPRPRSFALILHPTASAFLLAIAAGQGLTQVELATKAKVTQAYVAKLESCAKTNPLLEILKRLAKALGVPVTELRG